LNLQRAKPFTIAIPQKALDDLSARLARARLPDEVTDSGWEYGTNLAYMRELLDYWRNTYDWRRHEQELNRLSHYEAEVAGLRIHFIHQAGCGPRPKPLLMLHGWPGSVYEFMRITPLLTNPEAHVGVSAGDSFTVIAPSLPGYGFSEHPRVAGMNVTAIADVMLHLMTEALGYRRFAVQGGDWGAVIGSRLAKAYPQHVLGLHLNMVGAFPAQGRDFSNLSEPEEQFLKEAERLRRTEVGYHLVIQGTKPQTLAYGLNDSPLGLAAWIVEKFRTWSDCAGDVERCFSKDQLLTNILIYWFTGTIGSSMRLYYEERRRPWRLAPGERVEVPTALAVFPKELVRPPKSWVERLYNLQRWTVMTSGGHFAAMEQPEALAADIRAFLRGLS
jgi:pimeloyl-ACP methyl ester carboxylesterase